MIKFIEVTLVNGRAAIFNIAMIANIVDEDGKAHVLLCGDDEDQYFALNTPYEDVKALLDKALSN